MSVKEISARQTKTPTTAMIFYLPDCEVVLCELVDKCYMGSSAIQSSVRASDLLSATNFFKISSLPCVVIFLVGSSMLIFVAAHDELCSFFVLRNFFFRLFVMQIKCNRS